MDAILKAWKTSRIANNIFVSYSERTTGIGFHLASIRDAFECNNYHEGLHLDI